jgi:hypothetical protein
MLFCYFWPESVTEECDGFNIEVKEFVEITFCLVFKGAKQPPAGVVHQNVGPQGVFFAPLPNGIYAFWVGEVGCDGMHDNTIAGTPFLGKLFEDITSSGNQNERDALTGKLLSKILA